MNTWKRVTFIRFLTFFRFEGAFEQLWSSKSYLTLCVDGTIQLPNFYFPTFTVNMHSRWRIAHGCTTCMWICRVAQTVGDSTAQRLHRRLHPPAVPTLLLLSLFSRSFILWFHPLDFPLLHLIYIYSHCISNFKFQYAKILLLKCF